VAQRRKVHHSPPSSADVKKRVELYIYSIFVYVLTRIKNASIVINATLFIDITYMLEVQSMCKQLHRSIL
jgi:hypothetical protein